MVLKLEFEKELEQKFRKTAMEKYGYSRGALKKASKEAIQQWTEKQTFSDLPPIEDPLSLMEGLLSHLRGKKTSVQLQHEAKKLWIKSL